MEHPKEIALAFPVGIPHFERTLLGISEFAERHANWTFVMSPERHTLSIRSLQGWRGAGVIAMVDTEAEQRVATDLGMPIINLSGALEKSELPRVMVDNASVGRLAAKHLLECGLHRFAYFGLKRIWYAQERGRGFVEYIEEHGGECATLEVADTFSERKSWSLGLDVLENWLRTLSPPVGLMATSDRRAGQVLEVCRRIGLRVPDDIAVIGVNNDQLYCEFCHPPLTSVTRSSRKVGYEAARLLAHLIEGGEAPTDDILIEPSEVIRRASTDAMAIENDDLAAAVRFIHDHLSEPFNIEDVLETVPLSRRSLENLFKRHLRRTPYEFISELRVRRAKELLLLPEKLKLKDIAARCGFTSSKRMYLVFVRFTNMTPADFRKKSAGK